MISTYRNALRNFREGIEPGARLKLFLPGIAIAFTVGFAASFLSEHYNAPALLFALLLGMSLNFLYEDGRSVPGIDFSARVVLRIGVALLGFRIALSDMLGLGWQTLLLVCAGVVLTILLGLSLARCFGMRGRFGLLSGGAVGICGASAALAISAVLPKDAGRERDTAFVVVGVTALSTLAMIFYPIISTALEHSDHFAGIFIGATIHDVAQVVGAGYSISDVSGDTATLTKLMRVAMLLPAVLLVSLAYRSQASVGQAPPLLPGFLMAFVLFVGINSAMSLPAVFTDSVNTLSRYCLVASIAAIGLKTNLKNLLDIGWRPILLLLAETVFLAGFAILGLRLIPY